MTTETVSIGGMTCAACSARVERAIRKLAGIETATVNLATEKATVVYDPQSLRLSTIKQAIIEAGYEILEVSKDSVDEDQTPQRTGNRYFANKICSGCRTGTSPAVYRYGSDDTVGYPSVSQSPFHDEFSSGIRPRTTVVGHSHCHCRIPVLYRGFQKSFAPQSQHGFPYRRRDYGGGGLQRLQSVQNCRRRFHGS